MPTDQARTLFAEVVEKLWPKHPELVVPGWENGFYYDEHEDERDGWHSRKTGGSDEYDRVSHLDRIEPWDILAAAALCQQWLAWRSTHVDTALWKDEVTRCRVLAAKECVTKSVMVNTNCWTSAQFAAALAEEAPDG